MKKFLVPIVRPPNHVVLGQKRPAPETKKGAVKKKKNPAAAAAAAANVPLPPEFIEGEPLLAFKPPSAQKSKFAHRYDGTILNVEVITCDEYGQPRAPPNCIWIGGTGKLPCGAWCGESSVWEIPDDIRKAYFTLKKAHPEQAEGARKEQLEQYKRWLSARDPLFYSTLEKELAGKMLVCWCRKLDLCHGTILLDKLKELQQSTAIKRKLWGPGYEAIEARAASKCV